MFSSKNGGRPQLPDVLVLLTDGSQTNDPDAVDPGVIAEELHKAGIRILVIGIGRGVNATELQHIAGDPNNLYISSSFEHLIGKEFIEKLKKDVCKISKYQIMNFGLLVVKRHTISKAIYNLQILSMHSLLLQIYF